MTDISRLNILKTVLKSKSFSENGFDFKFSHIKISSFGPDNYSMYFNVDFTVPENTSWSWILLSSYVWETIEYYSQLTSTKLWSDKVKVNTEIDKLTVNGEKINSKSYYLNNEDKIKLKKIVRTPMKIEKKFKEFLFEANLEFISYDISFDDNAYMNVNYEIPEIILKPKNTNKVIKIKSLSENIINTINWWLNEYSNYIEDHFRLQMEDNVAGQIMNGSFGLNYRSDSYLNLYINIIEICGKEVKWINGDVKDIENYFEEIIKKAENKLSESFDNFRY